MKVDHDDLFARNNSAKIRENLRRAPSVRIDGELLETTPVFSAYWYFAYERQNMFRRRLHGINAADASDDLILSRHRFTNTYRASDRVSQYLIRNVIWSNSGNWSNEEFYFRILLFKIFNRIETWEAIEGEFGQISLGNYCFDSIDEFLADRQRCGHRNYSAAYIMPSAGRVFGHKSKHANHLRLLEWMIKEGYPAKLCFCASMADAFRLLSTAPSIGPFLAYQFVTDLNYSPLTDFSEMDFVVAGPGAIDGISKCFVNSGQVAPERIIEHMAERQFDYFDYFGMSFVDLWGRPLQLIDCQNVFCEISKYSRAAYPEISGQSGRSRIKQKYKPAGRLPRPWYPPQWAINDKIAAELG